MKNYQKTIVFSLTLAVMLFSLMVVPVLAVGAGGTEVDTRSISARMLDAIGEIKLPSAGTGDEIDNNTQIIIGNLINVFITLFGIFFMILMIYGGYMWMNARGNQEGVEKAKEILRSAIIGFIIVMLAYAISYFVTFALQGAVTPS